MRAIRIEAIGNVGVTEVPDPLPQAGEALVPGNLDLRVTQVERRLTAQAADDVFDRGGG